MKQKKHGISHYILTVLYTLFRNLIFLAGSSLIGFFGLLLLLPRKDFIGLAIGLPVFLIGIGFFLNSLWSVGLSIFSPVYNKGVCPICKSGN